MIKKLKKYIADNYGSELAYANHKGFSRAHINCIVMGNKPPTKDILNDIGLVRIIEKKESYVPCAKNSSD